MKTIILLFLLVSCGNKAGTDESATSYPGKVADVKYYNLARVQTCGNDARGFWKCIDASNSLNATRMIVERTGNQVALQYFAPTVNGYIQKSLVLEYIAGSTDLRVVSSSSQTPKCASVFSEDNTHGDFMGSINTLQGVRVYKAEETTVDSFFVGLGEKCK